jgi:hypothetical protein
MKLSPELPERRILNPAAAVPVEGQRRVARGEGGAKPLQAAAAQFRDLALGLPRDGLSDSLLSLAKFFSLPLDPKLILRLRQQVLALRPPAQTPPEGAREGGPADPPLAGPIGSAALAAAAAASKGVVLSPEALAGYAAALAGEDREAPEDGGGGGAGGDDRRPPEQPEGDAAAGLSASPKGGEIGEAGALWAERIEGRHPLLGVLNRLPGRDGRRWISLPFSFESGGVACRGSLRIALADTNRIPWKAERLALDVKTDRRRWSFMLENGDGQGFARAVFGARPPLKPRAERALRTLLGSVAGTVALRDISDGAFPEEEAGAELWGG